MENIGYCWCKDSTVEQIGTQINDSWLNQPDILYNTAVLNKCFFLFHVIQKSFANMFKMPENKLLLIN